MIAETGKTAEQIWTDYIGPLYNMLYLSVHIDNAGTRYHDNWIMSTIESEEVGGFTVSYKYTIEFLRGVDGSGATPGIVIT